MINGVPINDQSTTQGAHDLVKIHSNNSSNRGLPQAQASLFGTNDWRCCQHSLTGDYKDSFLFPQTKVIILNYQEIKHFYLMILLFNIKLEVSAMKLLVFKEILLMKKMESKIIQLTLTTRIF